MGDNLAGVLNITAVFIWIEGFSRDTCKMGHVVKFCNANQAEPLIYGCFNTKLYLTPPVETFPKMIVYGQVWSTERGEELILPCKILIVPISFMGKARKSIKHALQQKFTTCPVLRVSRLNPNRPQWANQPQASSDEICSFTIWSLF